MVLYFCGEKKFWGSVRAYGMLKNSRGTRSEDEKDTNERKCPYLWGPSLVKERILKRLMRY